MAQRLKHLPVMRDTWVQSLGREDPREKEMATTPIFLPGKSHECRSMVAYSPRGHKELYTTERLHFQYSDFTRFSVHNWATSLSVFRFHQIFSTQLSSFTFSIQISPDFQYTTERLHFQYSDFTRFAYTFPLIMYSSREFLSHT